MDNKILVILADDHIVVRSGLRRLLDLTEDIQIIGESNSGEQAYQMYTELLPDVLVMDMSMPGLGGLEALRRIISRHPIAKIVIYSMHENAAFATQALSAGARGYIAKSGDTEDLLMAIREISMGKSYLSPSIAQKIVLQSMSGEDNPTRKLSAREFEIFRQLAEGANVEDIAHALNISQKTVANYQTILKQKLDISNAVELVRLALRHGVISN
jgi:DNA-binding NarL/FixJ family response regulator